MPRITVARRGTGGAGRARSAPTPVGPVVTQPENPGWATWRPFATTTSASSARVASRPMPSAGRVRSRAGRQRDHSRAGSGPSYSRSRSRAGRIARIAWPSESVVAASWRCFMTAQCTGIAQQSRRSRRARRHGGPVAPRSRQDRRARRAGTMSARLSRAGAWASSPERAGPYGVATSSSSSPSGPWSSRTSGATPSAWVEQERQGS